MSQAPEIPPLDHARSVKADDYSRNGNGSFLFVLPAFSFNGAAGVYRNVPTLPANLPTYVPHEFFARRDMVCMATPYHEGMWANALYIAGTRAAAWGWELESTVKTRQKRLHGVLNLSSAGVVRGWVPFILAHVRSFHTAGRAVIEIERESNGYGSRIKALHHLNPLRCVFTDDPSRPVEYVDRQGHVHILEDWQCIPFLDMPDPTEGEFALCMSAAERAYQSIRIMASIGQYLYEKVAGVRPLALHFIQGLTQQTLSDALSSVQAERERKGNIAYMGAAAIPIPGDIPIQLVSIPFAEVPDNFNPRDIRDDAYIEYAGALGLDVNDIDPRLAAARALGSGAQAAVLDAKARGKGHAAWMQQFASAINLWVADMATKFVWSERSLEDDLKQANLTKAHLEAVKMMQEGQLVTSDQARNLLVDWEDIPADFVVEGEVGETPSLDEGDKSTENKGPKADSAESRGAAEPETKKEADDGLFSAESPDVPEALKDAARALVSGQTAGARRLLRELAQQSLPVGVVADSAETQDGGLS